MRAFLTLGLALLIGNQIAAAQDIEIKDCVVQFAKEVRVPAMTGGRISKVFVELNSAVKADDEIAKLDDRSLLIRRQSSTLRLKSAREQVEDNLSIRYAEISLAEAEAELETSRSIQNDVRGAVPISTIRKLRLAVERGNLELANANKNRELALLEVEMRQADLSVLDDQLRNLHIDSPIDGVVVQVNRSKGEWVERGEPVAVVAQIDRLHVHALVDGRLISPKACRGMPVTVQWHDAAADQQFTLPGKVLSVDPMTLPGGRFRLHAEVVNETDPTDRQQWKLTPGTEVNMRLNPRLARKRITEPQTKF